MSVQQIDDEVEFVKFGKWEARLSFRAARVDRSPKSALCEIDRGDRIDSLHQGISKIYISTIWKL
jgi:hypothetical protein